MYNYEKEKPELFTDNGQRMFLKIRDFCSKALLITGAVRMTEAMNAAGSGSTWTMMACVDRLVELGEIKEVTDGDVAAQHRVFVCSR